MKTRIQSWVRRNPDRNRAQSLGWFLTPDATERVTKMATYQPAFAVAHAKEIIERGFTVVPGAISQEHCEEIWSTFNQFVSDSKDESSFKDSQGLHSRLCNFHMVSEAMREAACASRVTEILDFVLGREVCIYSSLTFEKSTQQFTHRDCPFFFTQPEDLFLGVWFALEDVQPDAGPLFYYEGGHRIIIDEKAIGRRHAHVTEDALGACFDEYTKTIHVQCEKDYKRETLCLSKGDAVIWHPRLPHGGSKIEREGATRRSMVFHYIPVDVPLYGIGEFFLPEQNPVVPKVCSYLDHKGRKYFDHGHPRFDVNN